MMRITADDNPRVLNFRLEGRLEERLGRLR